MTAAGGVQRQLDKIHATLQTGAYYEAQQMYKTVYHRFKARRQLESSYLVLHAGAVQQLCAGHVACGVELGMLLVEAYTTAHVGVTDESLERLSSIVKAFPPPAGAHKDDTTNLEECLRLVNAAMKWAQKSGEVDKARQLKDLLGVYIWNAYGVPALGLAIMQLIQGSDADALAKVLADIMPLCKPEEADLFPARVILQTLAAARPGTASRQLQHAKDLIAALKTQGLWVETPLLHFVSFTVQAVDQKLGEVLTLLKAKYEPSLERDPMLEAYVSKLEQAYFNVDTGGGMGGLLGNFMKMLADEDDE